MPPSRSPNFLLILLATAGMMGCGSSAPRPNPDIATSSSAATHVPATALSYLGTPYRYGGTSSAGMDCSGLVVAAFGANGVPVPRRSIDQRSFTSPIKRADLTPGDLVFFASARDSRMDHVGIVTMVGKSSVEFIHATTRRGVRVDRLDTGYWRDRFIGAGRVPIAVAER